jgi:2-iminobutanoate/2-iminopropanoate deaminase
MSHHREPITADGLPAAGPYSHAMKTGNLVFLSGQVHMDPDTGELTGDSAGDRARRCLENLAKVAAAAGAGLQDAVRITIYVTDMGEFAAINEAYGAYWESDPPARVTVGVAALPLGASVEMDAVIALEG